MVSSRTPTDVVTSATPKQPLHQRRSRKASCSAPTRAATVDNPSIAKSGPIIMDSQVLHNIAPHRLELVSSMADHVEHEVLPILKDVAECWQPQDYLPDPSSDTFLDEVRQLREDSSKLSDEYLVVLAGDMITEEALPTYMTMLNTLDGVRDETGASLTPWARWTRQWTAEENRHGDLMNKYMYLTGRVDMRAIEVTIQNLIGSGMNPKTENNPYLGFIYTSFQERATKISHGHTAMQAAKLGDKRLQQICAKIAGDEARHEIAYQKIVEELFRLDPDGAMLAFEDMMKKQIVMPAHLMDDNEHASKNSGRDLFADFSAVAERLQVYTAAHYAGIIEYLLMRWDVANVNCRDGEAAAAQAYLMKLPKRIQLIAERAAARKAKTKKKTIESKFSWIYDRPLEL